jgi:hypothetical protein
MGWIRKEGGRWREEPPAKKDEIFGSNVEI